MYRQSEICTGITTKASCSDGYELLNARLEWASPDRTWTAALGGNNLPTRTISTTSSICAAFGQPTTEGQPGAPREWYISFTRNF